MIRNAAHRRALLFAAVASRQSKLKLARCDLCILEKHFIKVPEAVKKDIILIFILDLEVLFHHRSHTLSPLQNNIICNLSGSRRRWSSRVYTVPFRLSLFGEAR